MSDNLVTALVSIVLAVIGLASLSVILSPNAKTSQVIQSGAGGVSNMIRAATAPVTGGGGMMSMGNGFGIGNGFN